MRTALAVCLSLGLTTCGLTGCLSEPKHVNAPPQPPSAAQAEAVLDDFHAAASAADGARYFGHFAPDGVFLGTDASERWTLAEFQAFAKPYFSQGQGWTYEVLERHLDADRQQGYAWFDERLQNQKLGECRGSGVMRAAGGTWKVVQYNLTIPVPNDLAVDFAARIRAFFAGGEAGQGSGDGE